MTFTQYFNLLKEMSPLVDLLLPMFAMGIIVYVMYLLRSLF